MKQNKIVLLVAGVIILLVLAAAAVIFFLNSSGNAAQQELRQANPIFHTVPEGGACVPDRGDCQAGLTCNNGICAKS